MAQRGAVPFGPGTLRGKAQRPAVQARPPKASGYYPFFIGGSVEIAGNSSGTLRLEAKIGCKLRGLVWGASNTGLVLTGAKRGGSGVVLIDADRGGIPVQTGAPGMFIPQAWSGFKVWADWPQGQDLTFQITNTTGGALTFLAVCEVYSDAL